jgi:hypothetical protein
VLIIGTGRCGTKTVAAYLQLAGLDVGHEKDRPDGIVAWRRACDVRRTYKTILHVVREPLATIASWTYTVKPYSRRFSEQHLGLPHDWTAMRKALAHWVLWNELCEARSSWRFRIEDLPRRLPKLYACVGVHLPLRKKLELRGGERVIVNDRQHPEVSWDELRREDEDLVDKARRLAELYGYGT